MTAPIIKWFESNDTTELNEDNPDDFGIVQTGDESETKEIHIWNNKDGTEDVSTAENVRITTVTYTGLESGDTVANGKEVVERKMVKVREISETIFTAIGGAVTKSLPNIRGDLLSTPGKPTGTAGHESGGKVRPGTYYARVSALDETGETLAGTESDAVTVSTMIEQTTEDADSEELDPVTNIKLAWKLTTDGTFINGAVIKQATGGNLTVTVRYETDDNGSPSRTLVHANLHKEGVELNEGENTYVFFDEEGTCSDDTDIWLVIIATSGSGSLRGTTSGTADMVKYYDGTWKLSDNIENLTAKVISYNKIDWEWTDVSGAEEYKIFRTTEQGVYEDPCLLADEVTDNEYEDLLEETEEGEPLETATVTRGHCVKIERKLNVPTDAYSGQIRFKEQLRYMYQ